MQATFFQMSGYTKEGGNPVNNNIRSVVITSTEAHFVCSTIPGDTNLAKVFLAAGLHPTEGWLKDNDTVSVPIAEFRPALKALTNLDKGISPLIHNSQQQRDFLLRLNKLAPLL